MCSADQSEVKCFIVKLCFHFIWSVVFKTKISQKTKLEMQLADEDVYVLRFYFFKDDGI